MIEVRLAVLGDLPRVVDTVARALDDEAMLRWSFPADDFEARIRRHFTHYDGENTRRGWVEVARHAAGVAVWIPGEAREEHDAIGAAPPGEEAAILGDRAAHHTAFWTWVDGHRPPEAHAYLSHIGVAPEHQGAGLGSALMVGGLARADAQGMPAWLETSKPRNVGYYERFAFRAVADEDAPGGGPHIWFMRRDPA